MVPREEAAPNRKEQILDAAASLFANQGFYKTTTAHVAEQVGVTQPYVFHFFKTKEALYLAVLDRAVKRVYEAFSAVMAPKEDLPKEMGMAFEKLIRTHRDEMLLIMQSFTTPEPAVREFSREQFSFIYETVKKRFEHAGIPDSSFKASMFIGSGLLITLAEVLELRELAPFDSDEC